MEQYKRKEGWDSREGQLLCKRNDTKSRTIVKKRSVKTNQKSIYKISIFISTYVYQKTKHWYDIILTDQKKYVYLYTCSIDARFSLFFYASRLATRLLH
jgi:hypothetical protein